MRKKELYTGCRRPLPLHLKEERLSWGPEDDIKEVWASSLYGGGEETVQTLEEYERISEKEKNGGYSEAQSCTSKSHLRGREGKGLWYRRLKSMCTEKGATAE